MSPKGALKSQKPEINLHSFLWGILGFGIGGAIGGIVCPSGSFLFPALALGVMGAIGQAAIGMRLQSWKKEALLPIAGLGIFGIWSLPLGADIENFLSNLARAPVEPFAIFAGAAYLFFWGSILGVFSGASLGFALKDWKMAKFLALAGAVGFGTGAQAAWGMLKGLPGSVVFSIWGVLGGLALAIVLSFQSTKDVGRFSSLFKRHGQEV